MPPVISKPFWGHSDLMGYALPFSGQLHARRDVPADLRFIRSIALQCVGNLAKLVLGSGIQPTERSSLEPPSKHARDNVARTNGGRVFPKVVGPGLTQLFNRKLCKGRNLDRARAALVGGGSPPPILPVAHVQLEMR